MTLTSLPLPSTLKNFSSLPHRVGRILLALSPLSDRQKSKQALQANEQTVHAAAIILPRGSSTPLSSTRFPPLSCCTDDQHSTWLPESPWTNQSLLSKRIPHQQQQKAARPFGSAPKSCPNRAPPHPTTCNSTLRHDHASRIAAHPAASSPPHQHSLHARQTTHYNGQGPGTTAQPRAIWLRIHHASYDSSKERLPGPCKAPGHPDHLHPATKQALCPQLRHTVRSQAPLLQQLHTHAGPESAMR